MEYKEFKNIKSIITRGSRPSPDLTDKKWQEEFNAIRFFVAPYPSTVKKLGGKGSKEYGKFNPKVRYDGQTNWQQYCVYINDVLSSIRQGNIDYCYFLYQVIDLLKFHHSDLETKYCEDGYWKVWLVQ